MAKRFTDTDKWSKRWFRMLTPGKKLLLLYLFDRCDHAGFVEDDQDRMMFEMGLTSPLEGAYKGLKDIIVRDGWVWISDFVGFQQPSGLNPNNRAHGIIVSQLEKQEKRFPEVSMYLGPYKDLIRGYGNGNSNSKGTGKKKTIDYSDEFEMFWSAYEDKGGSKSKAFEIWQGMQEDDRKAAKEVIDQYLKFLKDTETPKAHMTTWLNQRRWESNYDSKPIGDSGPVHKCTKCGKERPFYNAYKHCTDCKGELIVVRSS